MCNASTLSVKVHLTKAISIDIYTLPQTYICYSYAIYRIVVYLHIAVYLHESSIMNHGI